MIKIKSLPVHISVKTVVVWNQLILSLVVQFTFEIHVLKNWKIWLIPGERYWSDINNTLVTVVIQKQILLHQE